MTNITDDIYYMEKAIALAKRAAKVDEVPVGCVIVYQNKIIAYGMNKRKAKHDVLAHAEINAIKKAEHLLKTYYLEDCEIYVTIEPCLMCLGAILGAKFRRLVFGARNPKGGAVDLLPNIYTNHTMVVTSGLLETECGKIMKDYFATKRVV
jgi:tRNA(adenine34) deaminase